MNTHDPEFRRAFRAGVRFYGWRGAFAVARLTDGHFSPLPYLPGENDRAEPGLWAEADGKVVKVEESSQGLRITLAAAFAVIYWNPDGKRWRRFNPDKIMKKQREGQTWVY
jgi:hypothetical protein